MQASQPDELTIDEQEMLEVIEDGDMEDWVKVRKHTHTFICVSFMSFMWSVLCSQPCVCRHLSFVCCLRDHTSHCFRVRCQARNKTGQVGYVPEKYLQFPTSNSLLSMLQSLATLDARSHTSSNSTEPELHSNCINGDANSECNLIMV